MRNVLTDLVHTHVEAGHNDAAADSGGHGGLLAEDKVGEEHVEHGGETPPDVVEGDPHVLEAASSSSSGKVTRPGSCLASCRSTQHAAIVTRHWYQVTNRGASSLANQRGALGSRDQLSTNQSSPGRAAQQGLVDEDQRDRDEPVGGHHHRDADILLHQGLLYHLPNWGSDVETLVSNLLHLTPPQHKHKTNCWVQVS